MQRKAIRPENAVVSCAVCGRTLLQGEHVEVYLVAGTRRDVCELCTVRANHHGWIRETAGLQLGHSGARHDERRPLLDRLRGRRERRQRNGRRERELRVEGQASRDGGGRAQAPPTEAPREPRNVHAVPTSDELKTERALELFNASEHRRTVAGVARSLGPPSVTVRPNAGEPSVVNVVVAWELCWYRYEVDLADEGDHGARLAAQGYELDDLEPTEQAANAAADEHGTLVLAS
jgi:hypothetical protein